MLLVEKDDLASHTSRWSSKLIHGGLRYLEYYEFRLVREALIEREVLLRAAPHIVWPLTFVLPHSPEQRPAWLIRLGLLLYDHLGGREILPGSTAVDLAAARPARRAAQALGQARLHLFRLLGRGQPARGAQRPRRGASAAPRSCTRTRCERARRDGDGWIADLRRRGRPPLAGPRPCPGQRGRAMGVELSERAGWA